MERFHSQRRVPPSGMPSEAPRPPKGALEGTQKPRDALPPQKPVTDEEPAVRQPSRLRRILKRIGLGLLMALALAFAYVFLLLGEPDEEAKLAEPVVEEAITLPMSALDMPGEANVQSLADSFGQPVLLAVRRGWQMQKGAHLRYGLWRRLRPPRNPYLCL